MIFPIINNRKTTILLLNLTPHSGNMSPVARRTILPFTAIVGQEKMKKALLLNAVNPRIGGVLIRGEKGPRSQRR